MQETIKDFERSVAWHESDQERQGPAGVGPADEAEGLRPMAQVSNEELNHARALFALGRGTGRLWALHSLDRAPDIKELKDDVLGRRSDPEVPGKPAHTEPRAPGQAGKAGRALHDPAPRTTASSSMPTIERRDSPHRGRDVRPPEARPVLPAGPDRHGGRDLRSTSRSSTRSRQGNAGQGQGRGAAATGSSRAT